MRWSERFATGVRALDEQHKMLFKMSEDYRAVLDEGRGERLYSTMLDSLAGYAAAHFSIEEQCMFRYQCPVAERNSNAHAQFVDVLKSFQTRYAAAGYSLSDANQLVDFVDEWLTEHIGTIDVQLQDWVPKKE